MMAFGIPAGRDGRPVYDPSTQETPVAGLYVGGDAARGPSSIIQAEADGRRAAYAILRMAGIEPPEATYSPPEPRPERLAARGEFAHPLAAGSDGFASREAERCLECDSACLRCVEVCPNRANMAIPREAGSGGQAFQILHVDYLCNECGNCGLFCPYEGEPFRGKATLFADRAALEASRNAGFAAVAGGSVVLRAAYEGPVAEFAPGVSAPGASGEAASMLALARAVARDHAYLSGGAK
jgi:putative selenate reductase